MTLSYPEYRENMKVHRRCLRLWKLYAGGRITNEEMQKRIEEYSYVQPETKTMKTMSHIQGIFNPDGDPWKE